VPNFRYRALTQNGEIVHGTLSHRRPGRWHIVSSIFGLLPIETVEDKATVAKAGPGPLFSAGRVRRK